MCSLLLDVVVERCSDTPRDLHLRLRLKPCTRLVERELSMLPLLQTMAPRYQQLLLRRGNAKPPQEEDTGQDLEQYHSERQGQG